MIIKDEDLFNLLKSIKSLNEATSYFLTKYNFDINPIASESIEKLDLTIRSNNLLKNIEIFTIGELIEHSELELIRKGGLGKKSIYEINSILAVHDLKLKEIK